MNSITINNNSIERKIYNNQPVVTFKDIDLVHERPDGTASRNFRTNKKHFIENLDFYYINIDKCKSDEIRRFGIESPRGGYLFTESGYLMLVKSFTDDLAWQVQRQLVNSYFRLKEEVYEQLELEPYKLEKKTYKGKPVMTVRDIVYLTGENKDNINWLVRSKSLGTLLNARTLRDFRFENNNISAYNRLNILFKDDVYSLIGEYKLREDAHLKIKKYFADNKLALKSSKGSIDKFLKAQRLTDLYRSLYIFAMDEEMREDFTEIISEKLVELGFLERPCRDLGVNTKEGWNLGIKLNDYKKMLVNN
ncbi:ORF6N domain-containing protein [uncultured Anaerococcus sp.]|uniref:ORF6N domain-containing protein n=1 Tax=uncultured Anaerococcus sp. TaxID=293428 RepID=UPI00288AEB90|nr:ORF6N domain-containing protein [uncultured Anaerococcus sp.]